MRSHINRSGEVTHMTNAAPLRPSKFGGISASCLAIARQERECFHTDVLPEGV